MVCDNVATNFNPCAGGAHHGAACVLRAARAADQPVALHAREHAGEARAKQQRLARHTAGFHTRRVAGVFSQHAQHAPLLVRQAVLAQAGPGVQHHRLARFKQEAGQVAVDERGGMDRSFI